MRKIIKITGYLGILGTLLMYLGDMLLYFTAKPLASFENEVINIMGTISHERLIIGGLLAPLAGFLYLIGFIQIYFAIKPKYKKTGIAIFLMLSLAMIFGTVFHAHFTCLGLISSTHNILSIKLIESNMMYFVYTMFIIMLIGHFTLIFMILKERTYYPKWFIFVNPLVLIVVGEIFKQLPQPFLVIISGGWSNISTSIFFIVSTYLLLKNSKLLERNIKI